MRILKAMTVGAALGLTLILASCAAEGKASGSGAVGGDPTLGGSASGSGSGSMSGAGSGSMSGSGSGSLR